MLGADEKRLHIFHTVRDTASGTAVATGEHMLLHVDAETGRVCAMQEPLAGRIGTLARPALRPARARGSRPVRGAAAQLTMPRPPHIVLIMADQLGARSLPAYGNAVVHSPHLDRLADEGVVFERALCASPLCAPSRASLMTGLLPSRTGAYDNAGELPASVPTFAHHLRAAGYRTVLAGKMHFIGPDQLHGFEERLVPDVYPAGLDWVPDWRLEDDETLPWYHDLGSVLRAGPVRRTLQLGLRLRGARAGVPRDRRERRASA